jgi:F0F1-type ATP synthase assembly protein I
LSNFIPEAEKMLRTILLIILVLALLGSLPAWPYSTGWGYYPAGGLGILLIIVIVFALLDRTSAV